CPRVRECEVPALIACLRTPAGGDQGKSRGGGYPSEADGVPLASVSGPCEGGRQGGGIGALGCGGTLEPLLCLQKPGTGIGTVSSTDVLVVTRHRDSCQDAHNGYHDHDLDEGETLRGVFHKKLLLDGRATTSADAS